jgi:anthranilate synthase/indole-3-glycerol phosphate synthase/phosphoribosylanthranilate isomerase
MQIGLELLIEVNKEAEMKIALDIGARIIGINNRDLNTFAVDMSTTSKLMKMIPYDKKNSIYVAALSGIFQRSDVENFENDGVKAVLVGESLMTASDPKASIRELMGPVVNRPPLVKVCGIMNIHSALVAVESGADFLGFIFVKGSRREVPVSEARYIVDTLKKIYGESQPIDENIVVKRPLTNSSWFSASCDQIRSRLERDDRPLYVGVFQDQSADYINEITYFSPSN